ncbi:MAG: DNA-binding response regulator [Anaerolineae bacterium]|nr:MAG: DNA-binding response regulator [Anaerolineae bacterium]
MRAHIIWIEAKRAKTPDFISRLRAKDLEVQVLPTGQAALEWLEKHSTDVIVVNAASIGSNGKGICQRLRKHYPQYPILLINTPEHPLPPGVQPAHQVLTLPFTARKLFNRLHTLLPSSHEKVITSGPIHLDTERNIVECEGRQTHITPRLARLLKVLMENAGKAMEREALFTRVWETAYLDDTRTLDVHISWLRKALEEDPRRPRYLKTIRGVGYRLDTLAD